MNTWRPTISTCLVLVLLLLAPGCSSDDDPVTPPAAVPLSLTGTVGAAGGTLTSDDGKMSLTVPAGVLAADTAISIAEVDPATLAAEFAGFDVAKAFAVTPTGLDLGPDAEWEVSFDQAVSGGKIRNEITRDVPVAITETLIEQLPTRSVQDQLAIMQLTPGVAAANVIVRGFSGDNVAIVYPTGLDPVSRAWAGGELQAPTTVSVGTSFQMDLRATLSGHLTQSSAFLYSPGAALSGISTLLVEGTPLSAVSYGDYADYSHWADMIASFDAETVGAGQAQFGVEFSYVFESNYWSGYQNMLPEIGELKMRLEYAPINLTIEENTNTGGAVAEGVWSVSLTGLEGFSRSIAAGWQHETAVIGSGSNGTALFSPYSTPPFQAVNTDLVSQGASRFGSFAITLGYQFNKAPGDTRMAVIGYGPSGGALSQWLPDDSAFGWSQLFGISQNITDAQPLDGDPFSEGFVHTVNSFSSVQITQYDVQTDNFVNEGPFQNFPGASGNTVSAFARQNGSLVVVTDGTPGHLYLHDRALPSAAATQIGAVGDGPRRVRVLGEIGAVSNYTGDSLTIFTWDQSDNLAITATIPVGDGPVGIDLVALTGGNTAIVSTGFNDNTWSVTVVSAAGALVSNTQHDLPAGATAPGHAIFLADDGAQVLVSCNGTDNVVVAASGL